MSLSEDHLAEWRKVTNAATEGPWLATDPTDDGSEWFSDFDEPMVVMDDSVPGAYSHIAEHFCQGGSEGLDDAKFVATARTAMPLLLDEVKRLRVLALHAYEEPPPAPNVRTEQ